MPLPECDPVADLVELSLVAGLTPGLRRRLAAVSSDLRDLLGASRARLEKLGLPPEVSEAMACRRSRGRAHAIMARARAGEFEIIIGTSKLFPSLLLEISDPPLVLYTRGDTMLLQSPAVSIVGTRRPSPYGLEIASSMARALASRGLVIASGLARGIDGAAHRGCLAQGGRTIAVLGCGIDIVYPPEHGELGREIARRGLLVSEYPPGTQPLPRNFPVRNRIISGLALGTMVVEAEESSGSLITARLALEQNREVFAVPGNITSRASIGPNFLIKQGAKLVQSWRDVVEELPYEVRRTLLDPGLMEPSDPTEEELTAAQRSVLSHLEPDRAVHFDALLGRELGVSKLADLLLQLELRGLVRQLPGAWYLKVGAGIR